MINENQKPALSILLQVFRHFEQAKTRVENREIRVGVFFLECALKERQGHRMQEKQFYFSTLTFSNLTAMEKACVQMKMLR